MGTLLPENLCAHRKGAIEELIMGRARDTAAQQQILFGKPTGDHDGPQEPLVKLLTSFAESLSHLLMSSCEDCQVSQIRNQVRSPIGDQRSVVPGGSSRRPAAKDRRDSYKRRCTDKHDQGCQATEHVQRILEAPHMYPTNYFWHHSCRSYSVNKPSQNPLLEAHLRSFSSKTISAQDSDPYSLSFSSKTISTQDSEPYSVSFSSKTISTQDSEPYSGSFSSKTISTQDSEPHSLGFSSKRISTQYTSPCPSSASSVRKECGEETIQSNSLSGNLPFLPSQDEHAALDLIRQHLLDDFSITQTFFVSPLDFSNSSILPETHFPQTSNYSNLSPNGIDNFKFDTKPLIITPKPSSKLSERSPPINISIPAAVNKIQGMCFNGQSQPPAPPQTVAAFSAAAFENYRTAENRRKRGRGDESGDEKREKLMELPSSWVALWDRCDAMGIFDVPPLSPYREDESGDEKTEKLPVSPSSWAAPWDWSDAMGIFDVPPLSPSSPPPTLGYPQLMVI